MRGKHLWFLVILIALLPLAGCGSGGRGGAPGSSGSSDTGVLIQSVNISSESGPDFDAFACATCCDGEPEPALTAESATMTIGATALNPDTSFDPFPASVEECNVTYKKANQDPASPIIASWTIYPNCTIIDDSANACAIRVLDIQRKATYWNDVVGGLNLPAEYPTHYVAEVKCTYKNIFGERGSLQVEYDFWLADFDLCS